MAEPTGEHVVRGGKTGGLNAISYSTTGSISGWDKCDDVAGEVNEQGVSGDHFAGADGPENTNTHQSAYGKQS